LSAGNGVAAVHVPVLLEEVLEYLKPGEAAEVMVDANLGEGGHAEAFLSTHSRLILLGVEVDAEIAEHAVARLASFGRRFRLFRLWAADFFECYESYYREPPARILFDLGISQYHYEKACRGFSFSRDEPLDMRLDRGQDKTAGDIVNTLAENELADLLRRYGEERYAGRIAHRIVRERRGSTIDRSLRLAQIISEAVPTSYRRGRIHPATRSFQALRIAVNNELSRLEAGLKGAFDVLKAGGRLGVICFHSLEDRIVKGFFRERNRSCKCPPDWPICQCGGHRELRILTKKPVRPTAEELMRNPASRSARFRVIEKIGFEKDSVGK
jgi:16S rRNA (cytosine1402-N4)-methyltransferase